MLKSTSITSNTSLSQLHQTLISTMAQRILPSERTIAFAAAVVSSKPADLTVRGKPTLSIQDIRTPPSLTNIPNLQST
jgi:hypothetical protein